MSNVEQIWVKAVCPVKTIVIRMASEMMIIVSLAEKNRSQGENGKKKMNTVEDIFIH